MGYLRDLFIVLNAKQQVIDNNIVDILSDIVYLLTNILTYQGGLLNTFLYLLPLLS